LAQKKAVKRVSLGCVTNGVIRCGVGRRGRCVACAVEVDASLADTYRQVGVYAGKILRGAKSDDPRSAADEVRTRH